MKPTRFTKALLAATALAALALLVVVIQNLATAPLELLFWSTGAPLSILLVGTYVLGALTARPLVRAIRRAWRGHSVSLSMSGSPEAPANK